MASLIKKIIISLRRTNSRAFISLAFVVDLSGHPVPVENGLYQSQKKYFESLFLILGLRSSSRSAARRVSHDAAGLHINLWGGGPVPAEVGQVVLLRPMRASWCSWPEPLFLRSPLTEDDPLRRRTSNEVENPYK